MAFGRKLLVGIECDDAIHHHHHSAPNPTSILPTVRI
ncbi:hypothetical protein CVS40_9078 [Lucilia cuprina]|nr:hypothetical protein CVS40_9078 [Lucilia cuprina]